MPAYHPLDSSVLDGFVYEDSIAELQLFLRDGQCRKFNGVPLRIVDRLKKAKSPGRFYMRYIRDNSKMYDVVASSAEDRS